MGADSDSRSASYSDSMGTSEPRAELRVLELCAVDFTVRQFISPVALYLKERGCTVWVGCTKGPYWDELKARGLDMVELPIARNCNVFSHLASAWRLARWIRKNKPDIVHVHTPIAALIGRVVARLCGVPVVVYTAHGFYFHDRMKGMQRRVHIALEWIGSRFQSYLFCVSEEDVSAAVKYRLCRRKLISYIGNGVDSKVFDPTRPGLRDTRNRIRAEFGIPADAVVITIMGRLVREKGFREFFAAARALATSHDDIHFLVVGATVVSEHDTAEAEIAQAARAPELEGRVHLTGMRDDIPDILAATDIFTLPSYREGLPVSVLEAMMMARPVVATRIRGCREAVVDGQTGFLVEPGSAEELEGALEFLMENPSIARRFGWAGRARALEKYELQPVLRRQWTILRALGDLGL